jgi:GntR family transcriptional regulator, carbon starvation induced regulator
LFGRLLRRRKGLQSLLMRTDKSGMCPGKPDDAQAADRLLATLREDICRLELRPGQRLVANHLMARYGAGQSPLREALSILSGQGLVVRESRRGFCVSPMSLGDLDALVEARLVLESAMLARAITIGEASWEGDIRRALGALVPSLQKVGDARPIDRTWEDQHRRFHFALLGTEQAPVLGEFCAVLYDRYDRYRLLGIPRGAYLAAVADDHADLADAVIKRDSARAIDILRRHIGDTSATVRANIVAAEIVDARGTIRIPDSGIGIA